MYQVPARDSLLHDGKKVFPVKVAWYVFFSYLCTRIINYPDDMTTKKMNLPLFAQMARTLIELRKENRGHFRVCLFLLLFFSGPAVLAQTKADLFLQALADPINAGNDATIEVQVKGIDLVSATGSVYVVLNEIKYSGSISDGQATIVVSGITETTDLDVKYDGDENYNPASAQVTITVTDAWGIGCDGSETKPYVISSTEGLDLLSQKVNDGNSYAGKYFKIGSDITYTHLADGAEGAWEENNYTAIGHSDSAFRGHFDGGGKTISGIRIYNDDMGYQGLFGQIEAPGEVKNVILTDMRIVAGENTGCVAGYNDAGTLKDNFVIGTTISSASDTYVGAIAGQNDNGTLTGNYYADCTVGSTAKATGIGCNGADVTANDGALSVHQITFAAGVTGVAIDDAAKAYSYNSKDYYAQGKPVKLTYSGTPAAGYQFSGFTAGEGVTVTASDNAYTLTMPASDVSVDVVYQAIIYSITYNGVEDEGVTFTEGNPATYTVETEDFTLVNPTWEGNVFAGWTYEGQTTPTVSVTIAKGSTGDKTFTANWKRFLTDEGITVSTIADQTFTGSAITPAITVMDGTTDISDQCDFAYSDNVDVGTATVVISAKESSTAYAGERSMTFNIISDVKAWGDGDGNSEATPYVISSTEGLDLLAQKVNAGTNYEGKYFKLGADITYTHLADGAEGADTENNYTAIGNSDFAFQGHFDGGGKTISGIRIYNENMGYQGLFGQIAAPGEVKNVILTDMRIVAGENTGCVAGYNDAGTLKDNFVIGTTISSASDTYVGAIAGQNDNGTLTGNYYADCTVGSTAKATGIGCNGADVTANDGALSVHQITFAAGVTGVAIDDAAKAYSYNSKDYYAQGKPVKLTYSGTPDTGYEFSGFTAGEGVTITSSENVYTLTMPASDVTVDVVYQAIIYNITYKGVEDEGVTFTEDNPEAYTVETESFALNNPSREGYLFTGWTYEGQDEPTKTVIIAMGSTGDKTFTANWEEFVETEVETAVTNEAAKEVEITKVMVPKGETKAVIPATVNGYTVTNIAKGAFYYKTGEDHVQDIFLPDKQLINIEEDALIFDKLMEPTLHAPLGLLSDYANMPGLKLFFEADKIQAMAVAADKYWTFSCGIDVKVPEGVKVYTCRMNDDKTAVLIHELTDDELGGVIKANNGVLLSSATGEYPFVVNHASATEVGKSYENNLLEPVLRAKNYASGEYYVLKDNEFHPILANDSKVPACKAVLHWASSAKTRLVIIGGDDVKTAINGIAAGEEGAEWYAISGQRIDKPTKKGLYIKNGKKVIIK